MTTCPECRGTVETVMARGSRPPTGGDLIVCLACGAICAFGADMQLHRLSAPEARGYDPHLVLQAIVLSDSIRMKARRH